MKLREVKAVSAGSGRPGKRPRLNRDEREFQAAAIEILETPASPTARVFSALIMVFATGAVVWSWFGKIDTHAEMRGKIIPVGKVQVIEPLVTGTVKAIHVRGGDHVQAGDLLLELDPTEFTAERRKLSGSLAAAEVSAARLKALIDSVMRSVPAENADFVAPAGIDPLIVDLQRLQMRQSLAAHRAEQASLDADMSEKSVAIDRGRRTIVERRKLLDLTSDRLAVYLALEDRGVGIKSNTIQAREGEQDQMMAMVEEEGRIASLEAGVASLSAKKNERREVYLDRLASEAIDIDQSIGALRQDLAKAELLERASRLTAPVSGRVQQVEVNTLGEVVQTGQRLMSVVPDGTALEVEGMLLNKDKGFVREGQTVRVKLDAFPFTRYGTLSGTVLTVSNDAIQARRQEEASESDAASAGPLVFPLRMALDQTGIAVEGETVSLVPGMSVTAEVKTGERRVLEFLLDPLIEMNDEAFHER